MKSFKEELDMIFNRFMKKMEEVLDHKEQSNEKAVDKTFNEINQQSELEASQDETWKLNPNPIFKSCKKNIVKNMKVMELMSWTSN